MLTLRQKDGLEDRKMSYLDSQQGLIGAQMAYNANMRDADNNLELANSRIRSLRNKLQAANARAEAAETANMDLNLKLSVAYARIDASTALKEKFKSMHPLSVMWTSVGTWKDGTPMSLYASSYNIAFDAAATARGISNPADHRKS